LWSPSSPKMPGRDTTHVWPFGRAVTCVVSLQPLIGGVSPAFPSRPAILHLISMRNSSLMNIATTKHYMTHKEKRDATRAHDSYTSHNPHPALFLGGGGLLSHPPRRA